MEALRGKCLGLEPEVSAWGAKKGKKLGEFIRQNALIIFVDARAGALF
jgi:hypothetical protein